jgi:16S rRNA (uracil1498-N3)-methyltransferase
LSVPHLEDVTRPERAFSSQKNGVRIILSEQPSARPMRAVLARQDAGSAVLAIGPEGGWSDAEFDAAESTGFQQASLGKLILRTETAVIVALASLNYALGPDESEHS